ncbi:5-formyltetrahydrofolate cyclo-ligase [Candidatus Dojkabacteria bacterium]|nr:5-formyltetrahydrofolate cyclo-ligase [Candidatus Dojkabacteria bacterium]
MIKTKEDLRKTAKEQLSRHSASLKTKSEEISRKLNSIISKSLDSSRSAIKIFTFLPLKREVDIKKLNKWLIDNPKIEMYLPEKVKNAWKITRESSSELKSNEIFENLREANFMSDDIAIIPGLLFSTKGDRLGRGGGTYDRYLKSCTCIKIGICFDFQLINTIPTESHDEKVDFVIIG